MSKSLKIHLALFSVALIYGITFVIAPEVMKGGYIGPYGFVLLRVFSACLLFIVFQRFFVREKINPRDLIPTAIAALFGVAANMMMFFKGLSITSPINGAVLMLVTPIFVMILTALFGNEKITLLKWMGLLLAFSGAVYLAGGKNLSFSGEQWIGDLFIILNALSYAVFLVYVKRLMRKYNPITVSQWNFVFGTLMVLPFGFQQVADADFATFPALIWGYVAFILFATTFLTYLLNAWALAHASPTLVGSYIYLQPVITSILSIMAGKDHLSPEKILFILLIFLGVFLVSFKSKKKTET